MISVLNMAVTPVCLTLMVTLMALFTLPLYSQPCLEMPPFWDPREAVSYMRQRQTHNLTHTDTVHTAREKYLSKISTYWNIFTNVPMESNDFLFSYFVHQKKESSKINRKKHRFYNHTQEEYD